MMENNDATYPDWEDPETPSARLRDLRLHKIHHGYLFSIISDFGDEHFVEAIPDIKNFLTSEDSELRYIALEVLTLNFQLQEVWQTARDFLEHDPDSNCRSLGASCLGALKRNTGDPRTLSVLAHVIVNEKEEHLVRESAYKAFCGVIKYDREEQRKILH